MGINLSKGQNISLAKVAPLLTNALIGLQWDEKLTDGGEPWDLDGSLILLDGEDKLLGRESTNLIFYNNPTSKDGAIVYGGDNKNGGGEGDDETVKIDFPKIDASVQKMAILISINKGDQLGQNFGQVKNAKIFVRDSGDNNKEIAMYDLSEDASTETAITIGMFYRYTENIDGVSVPTWKFKAVGTGFAGGLKPLLESYGAAVD